MINYTILDIGSIKRSLYTINENGRYTDVWKAEAAKMFCIREDQVTFRMENYVREWARRRHFDAPYPGVGHEPPPKAVRGEKFRFSHLWYWLDREDLQAGIKAVRAQCNPRRDDKTKVLRETSYGSWVFEDPKPEEKMRSSKGYGFFFKPENVRYPESEWYTADIPPGWERSSTGRDDDATVHIDPKFSKGWTEFYFDQYHENFFKERRTKQEEEFDAKMENFDAYKQSVYEDLLKKNVDAKIKEQVKSMAKNFADMAASFTSAGSAFESYKNFFKNAAHTTESKPLTEEELRQSKIFADETFKRSAQAEAVRTYAQKFNKGWKNRK